MSVVVGFGRKYAKVLILYHSGTLGDICGGLSETYCKIYHVLKNWLKQRESRRFSFIFFRNLMMRQLKHRSTGINSYFGVGSFLVRHPKNFWAQFGPAKRQISFRPAADFSKREFQMNEIGTLTAWIAGGHEHGQTYLRGLV